MEPAAAFASGYSSPLSLGCDSLDETITPSSTASSVGCKLRLMCSYGGRIVFRPTDKALCYLGGETRMVAVDRRSPLAEVSARLSRDLLDGRSFSLKYKLPDEDLDSLISVSTEEDLEIMIEEIDRISTAGGDGIRLPRLRLFLFLSEHSSRVRSILEESKSETWFVDALNNAINGMGMGTGTDELPRGSSSDTASINCLLGLEDDLSIHSHGGGTQPEPEQLVLTRPDSMAKLGSDSSSASTSSALSLSNLPPIPVPSDERCSDQCIALLIPLSSSNSATQIEDEDFDEKSEHGGILQPPELADVVAAIVSSSESSPTNVIQNSDAKVSSESIIPFSVAESPLVHQHPSQFIEANAHYIHHPTASTVFPVHPYHPIAMQQPPQASQIPVYYLPVPQHMPYPLFSYQPNLIDPGLMTSSGKPSLPISCAPENPESVALPPIPSACPPQLIQLLPNQVHPYAGPKYHWMQHPNHAAMANYVYEISADSGRRPQMYYSQAFSQPPLASQFQTVNLAVTAPEAADAAAAAAAAAAEDLKISMAL
ncbi:uncharacterized protein LOC122014151 [Zingiber officinale]|uniref:PB1 domain-containing protein n=1 Tax=Zingiber officinale TaxID=94328 RepID=A0A8J5F6Y6_ZINOF|nr:uncharacterized protein LOC122014151 [Zingiber officinale]KAG6484092.1 hypothetical protein ZIOFF_060886 [Zingiber officinale]